jgi:hypothetical protein
MDDPVKGLREMARVTRADGVVATCVWDHAAGGSGPLSTFFRAAHELDAGAPEESGRAGTTEGHLGELFRAAGIREVVETALTIRVEHPTFEDWWAPFTLGVGPSGVFVASLEPVRRERLRELCREALPPESFVVEARAWAARGLA